MKSKCVHTALICMTLGKAIKLLCFTVSFDPAKSSIRSSSLAFYSRGELLFVYFSKSSPPFFILHWSCLSLNF